MLSAVIVLCEVASENILIYNAVCTGKPYKWSINCVFLFNLDAFFEVQNSSSHILFWYTLCHMAQLQVVVAIKNHDFCTICFILHCIILCVKHNVFYVLIYTELNNSNIFIQVLSNYAYIAFRNTMHMHIYMFCFKILCNRNIFSVFSKLTL